MGAAVMEKAHGPDFDLESVELELAFQIRDPEVQDDSTLIEHALRATGGNLLFKMQVERDGAPAEIAAVTFGRGSERRVAIISVRDDGSITMQAAEECDLPIARIAQSYAGVMERFLVA